MLKNVESLNETIDAIGDAEIFEVAVNEKWVDFINSRSHSFIWGIIGARFYTKINYWFDDDYVISERPLTVFGILTFLTISRQH